jgi:hypothetical protein
MRPQPFARIPQSHGTPCGDAPRAARTLIRRVRRDALGLEAVEAALGVVTRDLLPARVDDDVHVRHGQRRLCDVRREHDARTVRRRECRVLLVRIEAAVERQHWHAIAEARSQRVGGAANLTGAGQESENRAVRRCHSLGDGVLDRHVRPVRNLDRKRAARHIDDRTAVEVRRHARAVDRRRHDNESEIVARMPRLPRERKAEIRVDAALVELVDDDRAEARQQRIALEPRGEDAFGRDEEPRLGRVAAIEPHVPADLASDRPALLVCDAPRNRARRHPPRLQ